MLAYTIPQPWATLIMLGMKRVILLGKFVGQAEGFWREDLAIHAAQQRDDGAWDVLKQTMRPSAFEKLYYDPEIDLPDGMILCRCSDVRFRHYYDPLCVGGALEPVNERSGITIMGRIEKLDVPIPHDDGKGFWEWKSDVLAHDEKGQGMLF